MKRAISPAGKAPAAPGGDPREVGRARPQRVGGRAVALGAQAVAAPAVAREGLRPQLGEHRVEGRLGDAPLPASRHASNAPASASTLFAERSWSHRESSSRKSGWAIAASLAARSSTLRPASSAAPNSVTITST